VPVPHVRADALHDLRLRHVDLRIQIRDAELTAASAAGRHLDDAERGPPFGDENLAALARMADVDPPRQRVAGNRRRKQLQRVGRLRASFDDTVDAEVVPGVGLTDLPSAGAADDYLERVAMAMALDAREQLARVVRINRLGRGS